MHALANFFLLRGAEEERGAYNRYIFAPPMSRSLPWPHKPPCPPPLLQPSLGVSQHAMITLAVFAALSQVTVELFKQNCTTVYSQSCLVTKVDSCE